MLHFLEVHNPFQPHDDRAEYFAPNGLTIREVLRGQHPGFVEFEYPTICFVNGAVCLRAQWDDVLPIDAQVQFSRVPGVEWVIAILVILVIALVVVIATTPGQQAPPEDRTEQGEPVYNLSGQRNQNRLGSVIEVNYGKRRLFPSYAARNFSRYVDNEQYSYSLFCLGQGEYDIHAMQFEDTPTTGFADVEIEVIEPGGKMTLFSNNVDTSSEVAGIELFGPNQDDYTGYAGPFVTNAAGTKTELIEVDLTLPQGGYFQDDEGRLRRRTTEASIELRPIDDNGVPLGAWTQAAFFSKTIATIQPQRFTVSMPVASGRYEIRMVRTNNRSESHRVGNTLKWESLRSYMETQNTFGAVTLVAVKARASNNLNNNVGQRFNVIATRKLPVFDRATNQWTEPRATRSPIWALCDVFTACILLP